MFTTGSTVLGVTSPAARLLGSSKFTHSVHKMETTAYSTAKSLGSPASQGENKFTSLSRYLQTAVMVQ